MDLASQFSPRPSTNLAESDAVTIARSGYAYSYTADVRELVAARLSSVLKSLERMRSQPPALALAVSRPNQQVLNPPKRSNGLEFGTAAGVGSGSGLFPSPLLKSSSSFVNLAESRPDVSQASTALRKTQRIDSYISSIQDAFGIDSRDSSGTAVPLFPFKGEGSLWMRSVSQFLKPGDEVKDHNSLLEIMSMPYIDVSARRGRPALLRRTSSYATIPLVESAINQPDATCEPTPVAAQTTKYGARNAVFTTTTSAPYKIRSFNDMACLMFGIQQGTVGASMLTFIDKPMHASLLHSLESGSVIPLSGSLIDIVKNNVNSIASFWIERSGNFFVWVLEEIDMRIVESTAVPQDPLPAPFEHIRVKDIVPESQESYTNDQIYHSTIAFSGRNTTCLWSHHGDKIRLRFPRVIGTALVLDSNNTILAYNHSSLYNMLGIKPGSLNGQAADAVVPGFKGYLDAIDRLVQLKLNPGVVVPEHMFRQVACKDTNEYFQDFPSTGVYALDDTGRELNVDIEFRIVSPNLRVLWVTFNRPSLESDGSFATPSQLQLLRTNSTSSDTSSNGLMSPQNPTRVRRDSVLLSPGGDSSSTPSIKVAKVGARRREQTMDDFMIIKSLGEGAYGKVCMATPKSDPDALIIIKSVIKDRILVDTWTRDRSLGTIPNEIRILNQLREDPHPNITLLLDFFEDREYYHIETELHGNPAVDLFDYIENEPDISVEQCRLMYTQVVSAVAHLHKLGIVHRDIKDENIIVDNNGTCQLIDFGSGAYTRKGPFDVFVGTVDFAAPEVLEGNPFSGPPQDVWALGILLYTIIYKENPFANVDEIMAAELDLPEDIDADFTKILHTVLVPNVKKRPTVQWILDILESEQA